MGTILERFGYDPSASPHLDPVSPKTTILGVQAGFAWVPRACPVRWLLTGESQPLAGANSGHSILLDWLGNDPSDEALLFESSETLPESYCVASVTSFKSFEPVFFFGLLDDPVAPTWSADFEQRSVFDRWYKSASWAGPDVVVGSPPGWATQPMRIDPVPYWRQLPEPFAV